MRKRYSRSYTVLSFLTMFSYRELPSAHLFMVSVLIFKLQVVHGHNIPVLDAHLLQPVK